MLTLCRLSMRSVHDFANLVQTVDDAHNVEEDEDGFSLLQLLLVDHEILQIDEIRGFIAETRMKHCRFTRSAVLSLKHARSTENIEILTQRRTLNPILYTAMRVFT